MNQPKQPGVTVLGNFSVDYVDDGPPTPGGCPVFAAMEAAGIDRKETTMKYVHHVHSIASVISRAAPPRRSSRGELVDRDGDLPIRASG